MVDIKRKKEAEEKKEEPNENSYEPNLDLRELDESLPDKPKKKGFWQKCKDLYKKLDSEEFRTDLHAKLTKAVHPHRGELVDRGVQVDGYDLMKKRDNDEQRFD